MLWIAVDPDVHTAGQHAGWLHEVPHKLATNATVSHEEITHALWHQAYTIALRAEFGIEGGYSPGTDDGPESLPI